MNSANSKSGDHRCASASCAALLALLMVCAPGCGGEDGATSRGAASRSTGNPYLDQLNKQVEIDGVKFPRRFEYTEESVKWDWAHSFLDYMDEKGDALFMPGSPAMQSLGKANEIVAFVRSERVLQQAITFDRPACPACGEKHKRVKRDLLYKTDRVFNSRNDSTIYEPHTAPQLPADPAAAREALLRQVRLREIFNGIGVVRSCKGERLPSMEFTIEVVEGRMRFPLSGDWIQRGGTLRARGSGEYVEFVDVPEVGELVGYHETGTYADSTFSPLGIKWPFPPPNPK